MLPLPPTEHAFIETNNLVVPQSGWQKFLEKIQHSQMPEHITLTIPSLPGKMLLGSTLGGLAFVGVFFTVVQPRQPDVSHNQSDLALNLDSAKAPTGFVADASATVPTPTADTLPSPSISPAPATLAAAPTDAAGKLYAYQMTLAQGFLTKAVELSRLTPSSGIQTNDQKTAILSSLDQALHAVNKGIDADPRQGAGFLVRARIYKTASVLKPELGAQAEQDLTIARTLGINTALLGSDTSALDYLPTEQATHLAGLPVVAAGEEGVQTVVNSSSSANGMSGRITLLAGNSSFTVSFPQLKASQALRVDPVNAAANTNHAVFSIISRVDGKGFTIQASQPVDNNLELEWRAIDQ